MTAVTDPAAYLRDTAKLIRERAEAATPGPWRAETEPSTLYDQPGVYGPWDEWVAECGPKDGIQSPGGRGDKDAAHIAAWDPATAIAVAVWLESTASCWDRGEISATTDIAAMDVARTFNRAREAT